MQKHYYNLRFAVDDDEWRARAKRALIFQFWDVYRDKNKPRQQLLDFGCGSGHLIQNFQNRYPEVTGFGIDKSKEAISFSRKRGLKKMFVVKGRRLPFSNNKFDLVTAIDVLEHIKDDLGTLEEIKRVLKPNGIGIFLVPAHKELYSTRDIRLKHVRRYNTDELETKCKSVGFKLKTTKNVDFLLYFILLLMCKFAGKKDGVPHLKRETAKINPVFDLLIYWYELLETKFLRWFNFPVGISILCVVEKK